MSTANEKRQEYRALFKNNVKKRLLVDKIVHIIIFAFVIIAIIPLGSILVEVFKNGITAISYEFLTATPGSTGVRLVEFKDTGGTNRITAATKQNTTWTEDAYAISAGTWTLGEIVEVRFRLLADSSKFAYLGPVRIPYTVA